MAPTMPQNGGSLQGVERRNRLEGLDFVGRTSVESVVGKAIVLSMIATDERRVDVEGIRHGDVDPAVPDVQRVRTVEFRQGLLEIVRSRFFRSMPATVGSRPSHGSNPSRSKWSTMVAIVSC